MSEVDIGDTAGHVLRAIHDFDTDEDQNEDGNGAVPSTAIRQRVGVSNQLLNYHLDRLVEQGLIDQVGTVDVDAPKPAHTYRLTADGQRIAAQLKGPQAVEDEIKDLQDEVENLKATNRYLWLRIAAQLEGPQAVKDEIKDLRDEGEDVKDTNRYLWQRVAELEERVDDLEQ
jgi:predicted ArsR family transcriptional regulator